MIDDLDEALRQLLIRDFPINNNEVEISFDQPRREWSQRLSRPTVNLFMHDMRENNKMRTQQPYLSSTTNGNIATISPHAVRLDVHYMITAWANDPSDEHRLLSRVLMVLYRYHALPDDLKQGQLDNADYDILMKVAQYDQRDIRREIWSMLDNEMRPIIDLTMTIAIEPYDDWTVPIVRETELSFGQMENNFASNGEGGTLTTPIGPNDRFYSVTGTVMGPNERFEFLSVQLLELAVPVTVAPNGRYSIYNIREGVYTVEVWTGEGEPTQHQIVVPSPPSSYDIDLS